MNKTQSQLIEEANKTLISDGDLDAIASFFTPDYTAHITGRDFKGGHKVVRDTLGQLQKSFPDIQADVEILVEGEDKVAWQRTLRATHERDFKGFPASGHKIVWRDMVTTRFHEGLIAEEWVISDLAEQLLLSRKRKS